ncbi:MAG: alpha/beta hydrolase family protein [Parvularculaceae bacterium]
MKISMRAVFSALVVTAVSAICAPAPGQDAGRTAQITVHGAGLAGTATDENPDRQVSVYLPPGYDRDRRRRYPVVYLLHGIAGTDQDWFPAARPYLNIPDVMDREIARGAVAEMIVVMPDASSNYLGSFYVNSSATGAWEDFIVEDLVQHIDENYRTLAVRESRGIAGHSMGGYGAIRIAMRHADKFSVAFAISPGVLGWGGDISAENGAFGEVLAARDFSELYAPTPHDNANMFYKASIVAVARAFSPNPERPPFYADFPFRLEEGALVPDPEIYEKWTEMQPLAVVERHADALRTLRGLKFDVGYNDQYSHIPLTTRALSLKLSDLGVPHVFEEYNGDHRNRLWGPQGRLATEVFPYFSRLLDVE